MSGFDSSTWQALGVTLTVVGLLVSVLLWRRRGPAAGLRGVAWSLLPAAAGLTGTLRLLWQVGDEVASWAVRLVFSPLVWAGIGVWLARRHRAMTHARAIHTAAPVAQEQTG